MNDSGRIFVSEHGVEPTKNEDGLVFATIGSARFVFTVREANALGSALVDAAATADHERKKTTGKAFRRGIGVTPNASSR